MAKFYEWSSPQLEFRRLKDRIDALCAKAIAAPEGPEFDEIINELREAMREHAESLRKMVRDIPKPDRRRKE
jgi:hypothetical protein